jgi:hypothetical protein
MDESQLRLLQDLLRDLYAGTLVPFVGAGISMWSKWHPAASALALRGGDPESPVVADPRFKPSVAFLQKALLVGCLEMELQASADATEEERHILSNLDKIRLSTLKDVVAQRQTDGRQKGSAQAAQWDAVVSWLDELYENYGLELSMSLWRQEFLEELIAVWRPDVAGRDFASRAETAESNPLPRPSHETATGLLDVLLSLLPDEAKGFDRLAERFLWLSTGKTIDVPGSSRVRLCTRLRISHFAGVLPTPAHFAFASLSLEHLIEEMISTNWDCCIETAIDLLTTDSIERRKLMRSSESSARRPYRVHTGLGEYSDPIKHRGTLRIYKINGCARVYEYANRRVSDSQRISAAERIVVTERQLQTFRKEVWARELLRDRVRSRRVIFSGFGSDEPQVRHTFLEVSSEASNVRYVAEDGIARVLENLCPWFHAYERPLAFNPRQVLEAFRPTESEAQQQPRRFDPLRDRVIDARLFEVPGRKSQEDGKLSADRLWTYLYDAAMARKITEELDDSRGGFHRWLERIEPRDGAGTWRDRVGNWLIENFRAGSVVPRARPGRLGPTDQTTALSTDNELTPTGGFLVSRVLSALDSPYETSGCRYYSFCDNSLEILQVAAAYALVDLILSVGTKQPAGKFPASSTSDSSEKVVRSRQAWRLLQWDGGEVTTNFEVWLVRSPVERERVHESDWPKLDAGDDIRIQQWRCFVHLEEPRPTSLYTRQFDRSPGAEGMFAVAHCINVSLAELIANCDGLLAGLEAQLTSHSATPSEDSSRAGDRIRELVDRVIAQDEIRVPTRSAVWRQA